ncbi:unnamed protein product [Caenorhabditis bovis]|uniref:Ras modification protein ERF4 n=1 Tax=Caenorhabditis bovis TaxID=2654633 RepID=A0A8S1F370_9PELO|nr:unnamed protein product [Caenorhabditis bovis]
MPTTKQPSVLVRNGSDGNPETQILFLNQCRRVFIQRDYSKGLDVRFETEFPPRFTGMIPRDVWENTIHRINKIFEDAEAINARTIFETVLGCVTCYCSRLVSTSIFDKKLIELKEFLKRENSEIYHKAGLHIMNPMERGLRVIEISILNTIEEPPTRPDGNSLSVNVHGYNSPVLFGLNFDFLNEPNDDELETNKCRKTEVSERFENGNEQLLH